MTPYARAMTALLAVVFVMGCLGVIARVANGKDWAGIVAATVLVGLILYWARLRWDR